MAIVGQTNRSAVGGSTSKDDRRRRDGIEQNVAGWWDTMHAEAMVDAYPADVEQYTESHDASQPHHPWGPHRHPA